jgi:hypothetical protein
LSVKQVIVDVRSLLTIYERWCLEEDGSCMYELLQECPDRYCGTLPADRAGKIYDQVMLVADAMIDAEGMDEHEDG